MFTACSGALPKIQDFIPPQPPYYPVQILEAPTTSKNGNSWDQCSDPQNWDLKVDQTMDQFPAYNIWGVLGGVGWNMPDKLMVLWMPTSMWVFLRMTSSNAFNIGAKILRWSSSRLMTPSTPVKRPRPSWKTMVLRSWHGLLNLLVSIPLRICEITSRGGLESVKILG